MSWSSRCCSARWRWCGGLSCPRRTETSWTMHLRPPGLSGRTDIPLALWEETGSKVCMSPPLDTWWGWGFVREDVTFWFTVEPVLHQPVSRGAAALCSKGSHQLTEVHAFSVVNVAPFCNDWGERRSIIRPQTFPLQHTLNIIFIHTLELLHAFLCYRIKMTKQIKLLCQYAKIYVSKVKTRMHRKVLETCLNDRSVLTHIFGLEQMLKKPKTTT